MTILHVTPYYAPAWAYGGVVRAVTGLARAQAAAGHDVTVLTTDALDRRTRAPAGADTLDGVRVVRLRNVGNRLRWQVNLSSPVGLSATVRRLLVDPQIEIVHGHELRTVENLCLVRALPRGVPPLVISPHGTLPYDTGRGALKRAWDRLVGRRVLRRVDHVVALTRHEAELARATWAQLGIPLDAHRVDIVPNGADVPDLAGLPDARAFRDRWRLGAGPLVLFLARLSARKGGALLLEAMADAAAAVPDARLLVAGPDAGELGALRARAKALDLEGRVVFTGMLDGGDRLGALSAADVFALPAVGEGFSMAVLEAMACRLPVVLSPDCHFPEVVPSGAGLEVPLTRQAWADALRALLTDPDRRASMGRRARRLVDDHYAWPTVVTRLERVYRVVLGRVRGR